ncbi:Uu.00g117820.m01.CDS01 [Anthostomella pinea]|uniref:Uu.00g117820.m01.CDS01 n=1 Tax=Anthostomella pinea TaxID=933095 RepID=A0AAI8VG73_9PEZI|nr:Uu.00g117820.m01.CDS01 [Anthostomella pinea]
MPRSAVPVLDHPAKKVYPKREATVENHTMGASLPRYLEIKVHQAALKKAYDEIVVRGRYLRHSSDSIAFDGEKRDKPFNWERPNARTDGKTLYIDCFPGYDHIEHYAEIIAVYLKIREQLGGDTLTPSSRVSFVPSSCSDTQIALRATNLQHFPGEAVDTVVLGLVWHLPQLTGSAEWEGCGPWQWILQSFGGRRVAFLGFRPAFWGDISGEVVHYLASHFNVKEVIYLGKLGALKPHVRPNAWLATGHKSLVNGRFVEWENVLGPSVERRARNSVIIGTHVTLGSVLHETKSWHAKLVDDIDFVDPEIGMMAQAAVRSGVRFGYLHMVTDNLGRKYEEDLSNERVETVLKRRATLHRVVQDVMGDHLSRPR